MGQGCSFVVSGTPRPWKRPSEHWDRRTGRVVRHPDPDTKRAEREIAQLARLAWSGPPATGPVLLRVRAIFAIPPSWPERTKQAAREARVMHAIDPDLDRLINLVQDALVGICYVDDNQVCGYPDSAKRYGQPERTEITVKVLDQQADEIPPAQRRVAKRATERGLIPRAQPSLLKPLDSKRSKTKRKGG